MTVKTYERSVIEARLARLPDLRRIAFGALVAERLIPNYSTFQKEVNWGNEAALRMALDLIWEIAGGAPFSIEDINQLVKVCEEVVPDSDDFPSSSAAAAQECAFAICSVLDYIQTRDIARLSQASEFAIDTIDLYVQEVNGLSPNAPNLEQVIKEDPLMQREIHRQLDDLSFLEAVGSIGDIRARAFGKGSIQI